jgi:hypothetical protein
MRKISLGEGSFNTPQKGEEKRKLITQIYVGSLAITEEGKQEIKFHAHYQEP